MKRLNFDLNLYKKLHNRIVDISFDKDLSHLSSCVTTLPILLHIYHNKQKEDTVILSNGHAGLAQYVCLEEFEGKDAVYLLEKHGIHPGKDFDNNIFCSTGSLGLGLPIAIGRALANKTKHVYCIISDGECCEGSIWESLYFLSKTNIKNISIFVNVNGISAYSYVDINKLKNIIEAFGSSCVQVINTENYLKEFPYLYEKGIESHYCKVKNKEVLKY